MLLELIGICAAYKAANKYNKNKEEELRIQRRGSRKTLTDLQIDRLEKQVKLLRLQKELEYLQKL